MLHNRDQENHLRHKRICAKCSCCLNANILRLLGDRVRGIGPRAVSLSLCYRNRVLCSSVRRVFERLRRMTWPRTHHHTGQYIHIIDIKFRSPETVVSQYIVIA